MKIKRYVAKDMRSALAQIKEELGADAVIMSNKKIPEGVELMAAIDSNDVAQNTKPTAPPTPLANINEANIHGVNAERQMAQDTVSLASTTMKVANTNTIANEQTGLSALLSREIQKSTSGEQPSYSSAEAVSPISSAMQPTLSAEEASIKQQLKIFTERLQQSTSPNMPTIAENSAFTHASVANSSVNHSSVNSFADESSAAASYVNKQEFDNIKNEMSAIRQLLEHQVSGLMWQDLAQKDPTKAMLIERLTSLGLSQQISEQVAGFVPKHADQEQAWKLALNLVTQQINTTNNDIITQGGIVALVGPTGVGKTTTIAKLAARFAQIHGSESVALISTDTFRIAGFEQLQTYGRIIGCQVKIAKDKQALDGLIQEFVNKKLVLIDTAGMGQRDLRLAQHLTTLISNTRVRIRNYLVLAANTQQRVMQENVERFNKIPLVGCIYTKLDESLSIGEIISTAIKNTLPIGYLTDGQRVPEDIKVANAEKLVMLANKMVSPTSVEQAHHWRPQVTMSAAMI
ncbi:MAG: flagellar biosynthesis protein FlhF [Alteromonadaceae bacterium]|nr:flagellar biosynthesis protein FlhF [Alteromonadaceae bacterium]